MIGPNDLGPIDQNLARRIIAVARSIAPGIDSLDGEAFSDAVAILQGVATEIRVRGPRGVKSQRIAAGAVEYTSSDSWFSDDDRSALRALCAAASFGPIGQFPKPSKAVARMWPEHQQDI